MPETVIPTVTQITVGPDVTVREMAEKLYKSIADIIKLLMKRGVMVTANQVIDFDTAFYIGECFDCLVEEYVEQDVFEVAFDEQEEDESLLETRPPVVVVMGHVDHGKTSLLDVIRNTSVTAGEAGGITQHIGAYTVEINGKPITFLDTPGHEAFTAMRMRGAQVTDIAVLVVAANDGVMPQTIEAINHAKAAEVEIIVAINKIDLPDANPDRVKQELTEHDLLVEDWGGSIISVPVSAKQKTGISDLLEMIILASEVKELKANPNKRARGHVIEAKLDKGRGAVATVLVESGTLKEGDTVVTGSSFGHIRSMIDDKGTKVKAAGPAIPVEIVGLSEVPNAGDMFFVAESDKQARQLAESVIARGRVSLIKATPNKISLDDLFQQIQQGTVKDLNVVVKADVGGSVEALKTSLEKLSNEQVRVRTIHGGVGAITESDVMLASASNAIIIGFNVRPDNQARMVAESEKVDLRMYRVIYAAIEDIEKAMKGMLAPVYQEKITGHAEIRQLFKASGVGTIAGCHVQDGKILRNNPVRIIRNGIVVYEGTLDTLRRFKDDVREVASGYECGMVFNRFNDIKESDTIESYFMEEIAV
ncbi:MAG: translation initiation factor IF-2 [Turicibacter sp.]|nr:translation initiation factor IF-2 [Turicibacter sp.]